MLLLAARWRQKGQAYNCDVIEADTSEGLMTRIPCNMWQSAMLLLLVTAEAGDGVHMAVGAPTTAAL
jgi:hypothetical protein